MTKFTKAEITETMARFASITTKREGSMAFAAGFFGQQLMQAMLDMPKHKQAEILEVMNQVMMEGVEV